MPIVSRHPKLIGSIHLKSRLATGPVEQCVAERRNSEEYAFLGDKDHALEWREKAYQEKSDEMASLRIRRCYDFMRSDPRYKDLERRVGYTW